MTLNKVDYVKIFLFVLIILSYFLGFSLRENSAGGAEGDFINHTWPAIQAIKEDFFFGIKNYGIFFEASWPMFHILNAFFNPFTESQLSFQFSITLISTLNFFIFESIIRKKFELKKIDSFLFASIILLLPCFRSSAFWGITENFGWLFLLLAIKFYLKIEHINYKRILNYQMLFPIFCVCLFSSLALYTRQYMVFFPIFVLLDTLFVKKNIKIFFILVAIYLFFSIPGFMLIILWGGLYDVANFPINCCGGEPLLVVHNPNNVIRNLPFLFNFYAFYLVPFLLIEAKNFGLSKILSKYYKSFLFSLIIMIILYFFNVFDYIKNLDYGGGAFLKIDFFFFKKKLIFFIIMTSIGFSLLYEIIKQNYKFNLILFFSLLIFCFPKWIFHEYYEPLILFVFFLLYNHNINYIFDKKYNFSFLVIIFYYAGYLLGAIYFKHYLFPDHASWQMFIQN